MRLIWILLLLAFPLSAQATFLDCMFFDGVDGELATVPAAWRDNLQLHNCARKTVIPRASPAIPLMRWASDLQTTAQSYSNQCNYQHSGAAGLGESIAAYAPFNANASTLAAQDWASEQPYYTYATHACAAGHQCGHYTQIVWRSSVELGCGVTNCSVNSPFGATFPNWTFVVCNYRPPGNFSGQFPY
ncbi:MAG: hypothetical protein IPP82_15285 [Xanthomonadales bacterium]|nr:hypothetical protein [Xanthomonadales bacterium]